MEKSERLPKIPDSDIPLIIERWRNGQSIPQQAKQYHCTHRALYKRIRLYCDSGRHDQNYADLVSDVYVMSALDDEEELRTANDTVAVTRAHALCKLSQWHKERRLSKLYGQKQELTTDNTIRVVIDDRSQLPVTPYIDVQPAKIGAIPEVIDKIEEDED